jgi:hypothetical protein
MNGKRAAIRRPWKKIVVWVLSALCLIGFLVGVWHAVGCARKAMRFSDLAQVQSALRRYAETHGHYPARLSGPFEGTEWGKDLADVGIGVHGLEYVAAGRIYDEYANPLLFYERKATRYGFTRGWYAFHQGAGYFHEGDPPGTCE